MGYSVNRKKDIAGERFEHLTAIKCVGTQRGKSVWLCGCDCGSEVTVRLSDLVCGKIKSCGCFRRETAAATGKRNATHGMTGSRLWSIWSGMRRRCISNPHYCNVSGCDDWENFSNFYSWAMASGYSDGLTLDRINVYGDYTPENCRWATYKQQENNRRNTVYISALGKKKTLTDWCEETGLKRATIAQRIKAGWPEADLFLPADLNNARKRKGVQKGA